MGSHPFSNSQRVPYFSIYKVDIMCDQHGPGIVCPWCMGTEITRRQDTLIAQNMRICDLLERQTGYDNLPLFYTLPFGGAALATNTDYTLPPFEMGAILQNIIISTDATAVVLGVFIYHSSIVPSGRQQIGQFLGTGTFSPILAKITMPAKGLLGVRFTALTGGTFVSIMASYSRSEQTGIEWMRSQRAGRIG